MLRRAVARGITLVEFAIALAILAVLLTLALPNFSIFLHNTQIRNAAEMTLSGLTLARAEAVRRNREVVFQLVTDLTGGCTLSVDSATNWVVSLEYAESACDRLPGVVPPGIIQTRSAGEGSRNVVVEVSHKPMFAFNGLGRLIDMSDSGAWIALRNPTGGTCEHEDPLIGTMRCLRIEILPSGVARICDPVVVAPNDPRRCTLTP